MFIIRHYYKIFGTLCVAFSKALKPFFLMKNILWMALSRLVCVWLIMVEHLGCSKDLILSEGNIRSKRKVCGPSFRIASLPELRPEKRQGRVRKKRRPFSAFFEKGKTLFKGCKA